MKKKIRVGFADFGMSPDWFISILSQKYDVVRDDNDPHILIFGDENFGNKNESYDSAKVFKVFFTGENRRFWNYKCHAAITFDHIDEPYHFRLPLYVHEINSLVNEQGFSTPFNLSEPAEKTGFASFVVSNPNSEKRNQLFNLLNNYKKVDSAGPLFNNIGYVIPRPTSAKIDFLRTRKFHLAFENSSYPGYITEKIIQAAYARTVPIYWGSTTLEMDFNPEAVINWHDYRDDHLFLKRVIEVDSNDDLYYHMLNQPLFRGNKPNKFMDMEVFLTWWDSMIMTRINL
jgi:hypothetical protein